MLKGKKILIGVTGSIAAYKTAFLVRLFIKEHAEVKVIMTSAATDFITPLTLATLSKNEVLLNFTNVDQTDWTNHVDLALWADAFIIAPASTNTLAKMANGICDNLLLATYLSAKCPVFVAPAMDLDMYKHDNTQANLLRIQGFGNTIINPNSGELASGLVGEGRMAEPEEIIEIIKKHFIPTKFTGKKVLITAGPTYEAIDPVRFIGNHSSGKMGFALASELAQKGAKVILVAGPSALSIHHPNITRIDIQSSDDLYAACTEYYPTVDIAILAAAVADYKPKFISDKKIKKEQQGLSTIELVETQDTLAALGKLKNKQLLVGFALETDNEIENAKKKIVKKNLDVIVLNSLADKGAGFKKDTNKITIIDKNNNSSSYELKSKKEVAKDIVAYIEHLL